MDHQGDGPMADTAPTLKCRWPLSHISIDVYGNVRPCCAWQLHDWLSLTDIPVHNINTQSLDQYLKSQFYHTVSSDMLNDRWSQGCRDCQDEQDHDFEGTRMAGFRKYPDQHTFGLIDMEIKFGNLCNQGCVMCSPMNSSVLEQERRKHNIKPETLAWHEANQQRYHSVTQPWYDNPERFAEVVRWAARAQRVVFRGGEPTVNTYLIKFLDQLSDITTDTRIFINTNGHTFTTQLQHQLAKFKDVHLEISIDGHGSLNEYIRWPNRWIQLENNVDTMLTMSNVRVTVSTTVQLLNVAHMDPLCEWVSARNIDNMITNVVWGPEYFQPSLAKPQYINAYMECAERWESDRFDLKHIQGTLTKQWDDDRKQQLIKLAIDYLDQLTPVRKMDWRNYTQI